MFKRFFILFLCLSVFGLLFLPSAAAGSVSVSVLKPYLNIHITDDSDEAFETFSVEYNLNASSWVSVDSFSVSDLDDQGNFLWLVPQSVFDLVEAGAYVRYRVVAFSAVGSVTSSAVSLESTIPDDLYITNLRVEDNVLYWDSNIYVYDTVGDHWQILVRHDSTVTTYYTTDRFYDLSVFFNSLGVLNGNYSFVVRANVRGTVVTSNSVDAWGLPEYTLSVDSDYYYDPSAAEVSNTIGLLYSGVKSSGIYRYFYSSVMLVIGFAGAIFLINKVH